MDKLYELYKELDNVLNNSPFVEDCSDEINDIYSHIAVLKDLLVDAGFDKK